MESDQSGWLSILVAAAGVLYLGVQLFVLHGVAGIAGMALALVVAGLALVVWSRIGNR